MSNSVTTENKMLKSWLSLKEAVRDRKIFIPLKEDVVKVSELTYQSISKIESGGEDFPSVKSCLRYIDAVNHLTKNINKD